MTELLYLKDGYEKEFDAVVLESGKSTENEFYVVLDKSAFYPEGGGQVSDDGILIYNKEDFEVYKVSKHHDEVKHWIKKEIPVGAKVHGKVNWDKRYAQMKLHTAQHLFSAIALDKYCCETVGNQIKESESRIDLKPIDWTPEIEKFLITEFNKAVDSAHPVHFEFVSRDEMLRKVDERRRRLFDTKFPAFIQNIRLVIIEGIDIDPCAGAHVKNTKELGHIEILRTENKGPGTRRVYYKLKKSPGC